METNPKKENEITVSPAVWMALRYFPASPSWVEWILFTVIMLIPVVWGLCFLFSTDVMRPASYYERMNCIRYEQTYEEIFIPALGKKQLTKVNRCVEYEVFE